MSDPGLMEKKMASEPSQGTKVPEQNKSREAQAPPKNDYQNSGAPKRK